MGTASQWLSLAKFSLLRIAGHPPGGPRNPQLLQRPLQHSAVDLGEDLHDPAADRFHPLGAGGLALPAEAA